MYNIWKALLPLIGRGILVWWMLSCGLGAAAIAQDESIPVRIGVLAERGSERCLKKWEPMANYLTSEINGYSFMIVPLDWDEIYPVVERKEVDFILSNSSLYVGLEKLHGAGRIATLKNLRQGTGSCVYGGVIFRRADRTDLEHLADLRGKSFRTAHEMSFGGWQTAWREMKELGIDPYNDFADLSFGHSHDSVVFAVRDGVVDAGSVRTSILEQMATEGKIHLEDYHIFHEHGGEDTHLSMLHSTRAYPEWPLAKVKHAEDELANIVAAALLRMSPDSPAAQTAKYLGWTVPYNYQSVHECLKYLRTGPYEDYGKVAFQDVFMQYWYWFSAAFVAAVLIVLFAAYVIRLNRRLRRAVAGQEKELADREQMETSLKESEEKYRTLFECSVAGIAIANVKTKRFKYVNLALCKMLGYSPEELMAIAVTDIHPKEALEHVLAEFEQQARGEKVLCSDIPCLRKDGTIVYTDVSMTSAIFGGEHCNVGFFTDISERKQLELEITQARKLEAVGSLAAGIAHEINTPVQFVGDNTHFLADSFDSLISLVQTYRDIWQKANAGADLAELASEIVSAEEKADLEYLKEEIPAAVSQTLDGVQRVTKIVRAMKDFAHSDQGAKSMVAINDMLQSTLTVARNELKYVADIETDFDPELPQIECHRDDLNQVFLNLLVNGAHAIADVIGDSPENKGTITVATSGEGNNIAIRISDTGSGIPKEIQHRIFDQFFTTKDVGKGSGQGLAIARAIITEKHQGELTFETEEGKGTTFIIRLPITTPELVEA